MRRTFISVLAAILAFITSIPPAYAVVLKDIDAPVGVPRTGVVIVAPSVFINSQAATEIGGLVVTNDADAKRLAESLRKQPGVHYVEVLSGTEATMSGVTATLSRLTQEKLATAIFAYRGFGLNADAPPPCFVLADWDPGTPDATCLAVTMVADLLKKAAPRQLVLLDATRSTPKVMQDIGYEAWGPSADDWPHASPVISVGKSREVVDCAVFFSPMLLAIIDGTVASEGLTMDTLTQRLTADAPEASRQRCGGMTLHVTFGGQYSPTDVVVPPVAVTPTVAQQPLPTKPVAAPKKLTTPTIASIVATGVCAAVGVGSWAYGEHRLAQYNDPTWAAEHYPDDDAGRIAAGKAEIPTYGYLAVIGGVGAVGAGATAGLTWYFGK